MNYSPQVCFVSANDTLQTPPKMNENEYYISKPVEI
jgi:hypothetical protein